MTKKVKTMEEFLDKAAIDSCVNPRTGTITVTASLTESSTQRSYNYFWTYEGNDKFVYDPGALTFDPNDNTKIGEFLDDRVAEVSVWLRNRGIKPIIKGYSINLAMEKMQSGTAIDMLNSLSSIASQHDFVGSGKTLTETTNTRDIYIIGTRKGLTPTDILLRIKSYYEKQLK